jgi:type I restriction-modification system DNA methylase subunit
VLFINADREYFEGRAQNYLLPEHIEKIVHLPRPSPTSTASPRCPPPTLAENDYNLNIRRYADNAPPPEPHDVRAHLHGGVWEDSVFDLQAAASRGWNAVLEGWLTTAEATQDDKNAPDLADQTAIRLLAADALDQRRELATEAARLDAEIKAAESSGDEDDEDAEPEDTISPDELKKLKAARTKAKKDLKTIDAGLLSTARSALAGMSAEVATDVVIGELRSRIEQLLDDHYSGIERQVIAWHDNLADKYGTTLRELEAATRDEAAARLDKHLQELGYD